ncbi:uncharacterized protein [Henckelia pumila]|uniref:uncharacterized protein isoform X1 n=1 Tax=Henckelia pumila TaxID=405737 RepID=UPI003C6DC15C
MGESLHEYWERFKNLCASCPQNQISENLLIQYFYEGLLPHDRSMVDAASGGVFVDKTPRDARNLIENMAVNSQQFGTNRSDPAPRRNNKVNVSSLEQQLIELTSLVHQMTVGNKQTAKACGICAAMGHATDVSHTSRGIGRTSKCYWRISWTTIVEETRASIQNLNTQVGQLATVINKLEAQHSSTFPSQTVPNPRDNASAITLRNGKELEVKENIVNLSSKDEQNEEMKMDDNELTQGDTQKGTSLC